MQDAQIPAGPLSLRYLFADIVVCLDISGFSRCVERASIKLHFICVQRYFTSYFLPCVAFALFFSIGILQFDKLQVFNGKSLGVFLVWPVRLFLLFEQFTSQHVSERRNKSLIRFQVAPFNFKNIQLTISEAMEFARASIIVQFPWWYWIE